MPFETANLGAKEVAERSLREVEAKVVAQKALIARLDPGRTYLVAEAQRLPRT